MAKDLFNIIVIIVGVVCAVDVVAVVVGGVVSDLKADHVTAVWAGHAGVRGQARVGGLGAADGGRG